MMICYACVNDTAMTGASSEHSSPQTNDLIHSDQPKILVLFLHVLVDLHHFHVDKTTCCCYCAYDYSRENLHYVGEEALLDDDFYEDLYGRHGEVYRLADKSLTLKVLKVVVLQTVLSHHFLKKQKSLADQAFVQGFEEWSLTHYCPHKHLHSLHGLHRLSPHMHQVSFSQLQEGDSGGLDHLGYVSQLCHFHHHHDQYMCVDLFRLFQGIALEKCYNPEKNLSA